MENETPKVKKRFYKRWWFWLIVVIVLFIGLMSCGGNGASGTDDGTSAAAETETSNGAEQESKEEPKTIGLNTPIELNDLTVTVLDVQTSAGNDLFTAESGKQYVAAQVQVENTSNDTQAISSMLLFDLYVDGIKVDQSIEGMTVFPDGTIDGDLAAGKKMIGWVAVEANTDAKVLEMDFTETWLSKNAASFVLDIPE